MIKKIINVLKEKMPELSDEKIEITPLILSSKYAFSILLFKNNDTKPSFYAKISRNPIYKKRISQEAINISIIGNLLKGTKIEKTTPNLLSFQENDNYSFLLETAFTGTPIIHLLTWPIEKGIFKNKNLLENITDWLITLHFYTFKEKINLPVYVEKYINPFCDQISKISKPLEKKLRSLVEKMRGLKDIKNIELPISFCHGDFNPYNILIDGQKLQIYDWEESRYDIPLIDILNFFNVYCRFPLKKAEDIKNRYFSLLDDKKNIKIKKEIAKYLAKFAEKLEIPICLINYLYLIELARMTLKRKKHPEISSAWEKIALHFLENDFKLIK